MASSPWIAEFLIKALRLYHTRESAPATQSAAADLPFEYEHDHSNLAISVKNSSEHLVRFFKWLPHVPAGRPVVTDDGVYISTTFLSRVFDPRHNCLTSHSNLADGTAVRLRDFEFRLANDVSPPRATLLVKKCEIAPVAGPCDKTALFYIDHHKSVAEHLVEWKRAEEAWMMNASPSSPLGIKSQIDDEEGRSNASDAENPNSRSVSQTQFATQIPMRESSCELGAEARQGVPIETSAHTTLTGSPETSSRNSLHLLPISDLADGVDGSSIKMTAEMTQQQLVAPSSLASKKDDSQKCGQFNSAVQEQVLNPAAKSIVETIEPMPDSVIDLLRHWRKQCHTNRYIPRRFQIIPKDQARLLESEDCWQPPLVGRVQRPGAVPLDLLNRLTLEADGTDSFGPETTSTHPETSKDVSENGASDTNEHQEVSDSPVDSDTEQSELIEWPSSPLQGPRACEMLPPDSSPPTLDTTDGSKVDQLHEASLGESDGSNASRAERPDEKQTVDDLEQLKAAAAIDDDDDDYGGGGGGDGDEDGASTDGDNSRPAEISSTKVRSPNRADVPTSTPIAPDATGMLPKKAHRTVQVKQTPFHAKAFSNVDNRPESSADTIPGTFRERQSPQPIITASQTSSLSSVSRSEAGERPDNTVQADLVHSGDAANEDKYVDDYHRPTDALSKVKSSVLSYRNTADRHDGGSELQRRDLPVKRKLHEKEIKSSKRMRPNSKLMPKSDATDLDYAIIDADRVKHRREHLGRIARKQDSVIPTTSSGILPNFAGEMSTSRTSRQRGISWSSSLPDQQYDQRFTPADVHMTEDRSVEQDTTVTANPVIVSSRLNPGNVSSAEVYRQFRLIYPRYDGLQKNFDAACQLLHNLHQVGRATHPSLWDDFIFRHFHDYRRHLQDVLENSGNALPYEQFYEEHVEQPTYLQRVVKPAYIRSIGETPASTTPTSALLFEDMESVSSPSHVRRDVSAAVNRTVVSDEPGDHNTKDTTGQRTPVVHSGPHEKQPLDADKVVSSRIDREEEENSPNSTDSRSSRVSVKIWLEKIAGIESPILGTAEESMNKIRDIPMLDSVQEASEVGDAVVTSSPIRGRKRRSLHQSRAQSQIGQAMDTVLIEATAKRSPRHERAQGATRPREKDMVQLDDDDDDNNNTGNSGSIATGTSRLLSSLLRLPQERPRTPDHRSVETTFTRFVRLYSDLPSEKEAFKKAQTATARFVDIFSWRN